MSNRTGWNRINSYLILQNHLRLPDISKGKEDVSFDSCCMSDHSAYRYLSVDIGYSTQKWLKSRLESSVLHLLLDVFQDLKIRETYAVRTCCHWS